MERQLLKLEALATAQDGETTAQDGDQDGDVNEENIDQDGATLYIEQYLGLVLITCIHCLTQIPFRYFCKNTHSTQIP
uniref:Uncharacterized protein n=1 Tax=Solanum lycopersicum TaxID=4081 RepID=A0A3Q7H7S8_SOLLC